MAAKIEPIERQSAGAAAAVIDKLDEQLRVSVEALLHPSPPLKPVEEVDDLLLAISRHIDNEASERKLIRNRLLAIENAMARLASRGFRYLVAICIGVAAILAWQSYGEAAKRIIATKAPELAWSPQTKQMIAGWMQQLGWTKPLVVESKPAPVTQTAPETVAAKAPATPSLDPHQASLIQGQVHKAKILRTTDNGSFSAAAASRDLPFIGKQNKIVCHSRPSDGHTGPRNVTVVEN